MQSLDSLPYINADISPAQRDVATRLIRRELPSEHDTTLHPSLSQLPTSRLTDILQQEINRVAEGKPMTVGIDLSRYESSDDLLADSSTEALKAALRVTYANTTFLTGRQTNISLLEEYGKNAWLIGNSHVEDIHKRLEAELSSVRAQSESTNRMRKAGQEESKGEMLGLEDTWKQGIGRIIETQLATDQLRQELMQSRSTAASGP